MSAATTEPDDGDPDLVYTPPRLGKRLELSTDTLRDWRYRGEGPPYVRLGKHVRYRKVDVDAWLAGRVITPDRGRAA